MTSLIAKELGQTRGSIWIQMVELITTLQKAPLVFSDAISVACTAHSWEMFCCSFGRILRGNVSTDISVTLHFVLFPILLFFWWHICWLDIPFNEVINKPLSYHWSHTLRYLSTQIGCLSKPNVTPCYWQSWRDGGTYHQNTFFRKKCWLTSTQSHTVNHNPVTLQT